MVRYDDVLTSMYRGNLKHFSVTLSLHFEKQYDSSNDHKSAQEQRSSKQEGTIKEGRKIPDGRGTLKLINRK